MITQIHRIQDKSVNLYLIEEPGRLNLIDSGYAKSGPRAVLAKIAAIGRKPADLQRILITHADGDHTGGAAALALATGATLVAGEIEAAAIVRGKAAREFQGSRLIRWLINTAAGKMAPALVNQIVAPGAVLPILGGLRAIATPGHTPGHVAYYSPSASVLFAGDALMSMRGKLVFLKAPVQWDNAAGISSAASLRDLRAKATYCGHGAPIFA